jgi:hypothetical protein
VDFHVLIDTVLPGIFGSAGALLWSRLPWPRMVAMWLLGIAASYYWAPTISEKLSLNVSAAGFFLGLFGVSLVDWAFRNLDKILSKQLENKP